jgi:hypothetical protein
MKDSDMADSKVFPDLGAQQKTATAFLGTVLDAGVEPLLKAQTDLLSNIEATMTEWLHRRHEAVAAAQRLIGRVRSSSDPTEVMSAQQEWVTGAFHLLAADASAFQSATMQFMDGARAWAQQGVEKVVPQAAAATQAAMKPLRMAAKAD